MHYRFICFFFLLTLFIQCKSEKPTKKDSNSLSPLDSIELVNSQSVKDAGDYITKAYIDLETDEFSIRADMKRDHRIFGYQEPDSNSKRLILFSIFTNDVEGNPFELPLGAYYDTTEMEDISIKYIGQNDDFIETEIMIEGESNTVYFERTWVILEDDDQDETIREYGKVVKLEDGAYPMYIVTIDFVERNFSVDFNLNLEEVNIDGETLNNLPGKYVTFDYTSELIADLNDIHFNGKSLYGKYAPEMDDTWNRFTGTLSGAESLSGDLPNLVTITNNEGETKNFELYVDDTVMKANGKEVTAYHSERAVNTIVRIEPSED
jgi:hypothetical protein